MFKKIFIHFVFGTLLILPVSAQNLGADELINISVYERINPAIVAIEANLSDGFSAGTGCVVRSDGVILTGSHVVEGANEIDVTTSDGKVYKASVLAKMGKNKDLALLKIAPKSYSLQSFDGYEKSRSLTKSNPHLSITQQSEIHNTIKMYFL